MQERNAADKKGCEDDDDDLGDDQNYGHKPGRDDETEGGKAIEPIPFNQRPSIQIISIKRMTASRINSPDKTLSITDASLRRSAPGM